MNADKYFVTQKPSNEFLSSLVDYYFYIDIEVSKLSLTEEFIIPFPRITFGYFFDSPFLATNHTLKRSALLNMAISRISTDRITVQPQGDRIRILGAHVRPFCLAYLTKQPIHTMPWLIDTVDLFKQTAADFKGLVDKCTGPQQMFDVVESTFMNNLLVRDLSLISTAVKLIDDSAGNIQIVELAKKVSVSDRTIRTHFENHVGCSPKEYIRLVKLKQVAYQLKNSKESLTNIALDNNYFDQAHFIHEVKGITGKSPNNLKKEIPSFRFLQF